MRAIRKLERQRAKPYCFVSYSSRDPHINVLIPCLWIALSRSFDLKLTPSPLESGADQHAQIVDLIKDCAFAVVVLDGLRANVVYEYGLLVAYEKPIILLKEENATVDIRSLVGETVNLGVAAPTLKVDDHFSDIKGVNYAQWNWLRPADTIKVIWQEYRKKQSTIAGYVEIEEQGLWVT